MIAVSLHIIWLWTLFAPAQPPVDGASSPTPAAGTPDPVRLQLARNIGGLIQPCAARTRPPSMAARSIVTTLRVNVSRDGIPTSHEVVQVTGVTDANSAQVDNVIAIALGAARACASRVSTLPADRYDVPGGWKSYMYRFRFP